MLSFWIAFCLLWVSCAASPLSDNPCHGCGCSCRAVSLVSQDAPSYASCNDPSRTFHLDGCESFYNCRTRERFNPFKHTFCKQPQGSPERMSGRATRMLRRIARRSYLRAADAYVLSEGIESAINSTDYNPILSENPEDRPIAACVHGCACPCNMTHYARYARREHRRHRRRGRGRHGRILNQVSQEDDRLYEEHIIGQLVGRLTNRYRETVLSDNNEESLSKKCMVWAEKCAKDCSGKEKEARQACNTRCRDRLPFECP